MDFTLAWDRRRTAILVAAAAFAALALLIYSRHHSRAAAEIRLKQTKRKSRDSPSAVVFLEKAHPHRKLSCPVIPQAFSEHNLCANQWLSQPVVFRHLARMSRRPVASRRLRTPEVDQQLQQARATWIPRRPT